MNQFANRPQFSNDSDGKIRRFVHTPITLDHNGIQFSIKENGRVVLTAVAKDSPKDMIEYDEIEVPASLIFKVAQFLRGTRKVEFVSVNELKPGDATEDSDSARA